MITDMRNLRWYENIMSLFYCCQYVPFQLILTLAQTFIHRDETPHVPNEYLGEEAVVSIIGNLTQLIKEVFPSK